MGGSVRLHSSALWSEYRTIAENPSPRRLLDLLEKVLRDGGGEINDIIAFLQGISRTLSVRARESSELLAPSQCLATAAVSLLPKIDLEEARCYACQMLREIVSEDAAVWTQTLAGVKADSLAFLSDASPLSDLYYLPIRLVKTLGWIGLSILMRALLPGVSDSEDSIGWELAMEIPIATTHP